MGEIKKLIGSRHAIERIHKRISIKKKSVKKHIETVRQKGTRHTKITGRLRRFIDKCIQNKKLDGIIYGNYLYIVDKTKIVTTYNIPSEMIKFRKKK